MRKEFGRGKVQARVAYGGARASLPLSFRFPNPPTRRAMDAASLLSATLSPDQNERQHATSQLEQYLDSNPSQYLVSLSHSLSDQQTPSHIRNAAGLAIKNALSAREVQRQDDYAQRWKQLESQTRDKLKQDAVQTLAATDKGARNVSGQVIAAIAAIELPLGQWNSLVGQLLELVGRADNSGLRQATLQAIGYICETIVSLKPDPLPKPVADRSSLVWRVPVLEQKPEVLAAQSNEILTAVVQGARKEEPR